MVQWPLLNELRGTIINAPPDACVFVDISSINKVGSWLQDVILARMSIPLSPTFSHMPL